MPGVAPENDSCLISSINEHLKQDILPIDPINHTNQCGAFTWATQD